MNQLRCPNCGYQADVDTFIRLRKAPNRADEVNVVYRCPQKGCRHIFSPKSRSGLWVDLTQAGQSPTV